MSDYLLDNAFPIELMTRIFVALPIKSLGRARCVCKSWNKFLSSNSFMSMHAQTILQPMAMMALETANGDFEVHHLWSPSSTSMMDGGDAFIVQSMGSNTSLRRWLWWPHCGALASSGGLICYLVKEVLGNLAIGVYRTVPALRNMEHLLGFLFEPNTCLFKIMALSKEGVFLFDSSRRAWKPINPPASKDDYCYITEHITPWAPYVACARGKCYFNPVYDEKHIAFDMVNEEWESILDLPTGVYGRIQAWEDRVYMINESLEPEYVSIWVLEDNRWVEKINIDVRSISGWGFFPVIYHGDIVFLVDSPKVFVYNIKIAAMVDEINLEESFGSPHFFPYKLTLFHPPIFA
ncbi:hypothetical protein AMTRI_Chr08g204060 [Amborella trichopoda]